MQSTTASHSRDNHCFLTSCSARLEPLNGGTQHVRVRDESIAFYGKGHPEQAFGDVCGQCFVSITLWAIETHRIEVPAAETFAA
jgi:hypothetical protein